MWKFFFILIPFHYNLSDEWYFFQFFLCFMISFFGQASFFYTSKVVIFSLDVLEFYVLCLLNVIRQSFFREEKLTITVVV